MSELIPLEGLSHARRLLLEQLAQCSGMTHFQYTYLTELVRRPGFREFVLINGSVRETFHRTVTGPFTVLWYDTSDELNMVRIGRIKVLQQQSSVGHAT